MPLSSPFDAVARRSRLVPANGQPDPDYVPPDPNQPDANDYTSAPTPFQAQRQQADDSGQQELARRAAQAKLDAAAAAKQQAAQDKIDEGNAATQARVDAANNKANGVSTTQQAVIGPGGKAVDTSVPNTNPDGTTKYNEADLGVMQDTNGTPYKVRRNQWGAQEWTDPYQAGTAHVRIGPGGNLLAKPIGKGTADLPEKDVTDSQPIPQELAGQLDEREQKLVKDAAAQRVKDTVVPAADQAASDLADARQAHTDARMDYVAAKANQVTDPDTFAKAEATELASRQALTSAAMKHNSAQQDKRDALADPVAWTQKQVQAQQASVGGQQPDNAPAAQPGQNQTAPAAGSPPDPNNANLSSQTSPVPAPASGSTPNGQAAPAPQAPDNNGSVVPAPSQASPQDASAQKSTAPPDFKSLSFWDLIAYSPDNLSEEDKAKYKEALQQKSADTPEATAAARAALDKLPLPASEVHPMSAAQDFVNNFDQSFTKFSGQAVRGAANLGEIIDQSNLNPEKWIDKGVKAITGIDVAKQRAAVAAKIDTGGAQAEANAAKLYPTDEARDKSLERKASDVAATVLPFLAAGPSKLGLAVTNTVAGVSTGQGTREDVLARGGSTTAANAAGLASGVVLGLANKIFGPFAKTFEKLMPGASPTLAKAAINFVVGGAFKSAKQGAEFGIINAASGAATNLALDASAAPKTSADGSSNRVDISKTYADGVTTGALLGGLSHVGEFASQEYNNMAVGQAMKKQAANASFVQTVAKAHDAIDASQAAGQMNSKQAQEAKDSLVHFLTPENKNLVQAHANNVLDAQRKITAITNDAAAQTVAAGAGHPELAKLSDQDLEAQHVETTAMIDAGATDPSLQAKEFALSDEVNRRQKIAAIQSDATAKLKDVSDKLEASTAATQDLSRQPNGHEMLRAVNEFNAKGDPTTPKANATTAQSAMDMAPKPPGLAAEALSPVSPHYIPIAHAIENLPDPDQQGIATAAVKLINGRALTGDEQALMFGNPKAGIPAAAEANTGKPFADQANGKPILTDAGMERLKQLVPQVADILPKSEQAQREITPPPLPKGNGKQSNTSPGSVKKTAENSHEAGPSEGTIIRPAPRTGDLKHIPDESLNVRINNLHAAIQKAKEAGASLPPSALTEMMKLQGEVNHRHHDLNPAQPGDAVEYVHDSATGAEHRHGEVIGVNPGKSYHLIDVGDGSERTVPLSHILKPNEAAPEAKEPEPVASEPDQADSAGDEKNHVPVEEQPSEHIPGIEPVEETKHPAAAAIIHGAIKAYEPILTKLGMKYKPGNIDSDEGLGLALDPNDGQMVIDLKALTESMASLKDQGFDDEAIKARIEAAFGEEVEHATGEKVAEQIAGEEGIDKDDVWSALWNDLSPEQQKSTHGIYGKSLGKQSDANRGREYFRIMQQLASENRFTEVAHLLTSKSKAFLQAVIDYIGDIAKKLKGDKTSPLLDEMSKRAKAMLEGKSDSALTADESETLMSHADEAPHDTASPDDASNHAAVSKEAGDGASPESRGEQTSLEQPADTVGPRGGKATGPDQVSADTRSARPDAGPGDTGGSEQSEPLGTEPGGRDQQRQSRRLAEPDPASPVNQAAFDRANDSLKNPEKGKGFRFKSARFVGQDGNTGHITKLASGKFRVSYFDGNSKTPWKITTSTTLPQAIKNLTSRGFGLMSDADIDLARRLSNLPPDSVKTVIQNPEVTDDQLHVLNAALTDMHKPFLARKVMDEIDAREHGRQMDQQENQRVQDLHDQMGPSLAESIMAKGGLPNPVKGQPFYGELQRVKEAWNTLKKKGDPNWYEKKIRQGKLFTDDPKHSTEEMLDKHIRNEGFDQEASPGDHLAALEHELTSGNPKYPDDFTRSNAAPAGKPIKATYQGAMDRSAVNKPPLHLWHLDEELPGFENGSSVDEERLNAAGHILPPRDNTVNASPVRDGFYSQLEKTLAEKMPNKAPSGMVTAIARTSGVKADEMKWSGIEDFLKDKPQVTKQEVADYLADAGRVKIERHTLGNTPIPTPDLQRMNALDDSRRRTTAEDQELKDLRDRFYGDLTGTSQATKYEDKQLPGGTNYREQVFTLPETREEAQRNNAIRKTNAERRAQNLPPTTEWTHVEDRYTSAHFPQPNYLAHMRLNDRTDADGNPGTFIEELQSDRHQAGRDRGYQGDRENLSDEDVRAYHDISPAVWNQATESEKAELRREAKKAGESPGVPDAPFRKTWHEFLFRKALGDAIAADHKWIGWTTGETQSDRYDLAKQVDRIVASKGGDDGYDLAIYTKNDPSHPHEMNVSRGELPDHVGEDLANKIVSDDSDEEKTYTAGDLKVGGEGMKGFYDKIVPSYVAKYAKQWGVKPEMASIDVPQSTASDGGRLQYEVRDPQGQPYDAFPTREGAEQAAADAGPGHTVHSVDRTNAQPIWKLPINDQMRDSIKNTGQPIFARSVKDDHTPDMFEAPKAIDTPKPAEPAMSKEAALRAYNKLAPDRATLKLDQARTLEMAEKALGQDFIPGSDVESRKKMEDAPTAKESTKPPERPASKDQSLFDTGADALSGKQNLLFSSAVKEQNMRDTAEKALGFVDHIARGELPMSVANKIPEDVHTVAKLMHEAKDDVVKVWAPQLRSDAAGKTARSLSANLADIARNRDHAEAALRTARSFFDRKPLEYNHSIIAAIEDNRAHADPEAQPFIDAMRTINNQRRDVVRSMPGTHFRNFIENYFPHIWAQGDVGKATKFYQRKIEGSRAFLKHRSIPTVAEGLDAGLHLASDNPVDLFLIRWNQMDKYVAGQRMLGEMKDMGIAQHFRADAEAPEGWRQIDNRIGLSTESVPADKDTPGAYEVKNTQDDLPGLPPRKAFAQDVTRKYYAPESAAQVIENNLSPGLRDKAAYKLISGAANTMNQAQLGFSAFHAGFTTYDTMVSKLAAGLEDLAAKRPLDAAKAVISLPVTPVTNLMQGSKLLKEWYKPGSQGEEMGKLANAIIQGGGRTQMDPMYSNQMMKSFLKNWRQGNIFGAAWRAPLAALEAASKPIMEWLVPRQKLGVFADLARREMQKLGPNASQDDVRKAMQSAWASVDNRMGQLVYDNLHWNKTAKDMSMIITRSVGWNLGSYRELLGGLKDIATAGGNFLDHLGAADGAESKKVEFTHRMAYTLALPLLTGASGALIQYLYTGKGPDELRDYFFPKTGELDANGHNIRIAQPTYMKDVYGFAHQPGQTFVNKANPIISMMGNLWSNRDFWGTQIRNPKDNDFQQAAEMLGFVGKSFAPFAATGAVQNYKDQGHFNASTFLPFVGLTPAAKWIDKSAAELKADDIAQAHASSAPRSQEQQDESQAKKSLMQKLHDVDPIHSTSPEDRAKRSLAMGDAIKQAIKDKVIAPNQVNRLITRMRMTPLQRSFQYMEYDDAKDVWNLASPEEKKTLLPMFAEKMERAGKAGKEVDPKLLKLSK